MEAERDSIVAFWLECGMRASLLRGRTGPVTGQLLWVQLGPGMQPCSRGKEGGM